MIQSLTTTPTPRSQPGRVLRLIGPLAALLIALAGCQTGAPKADQTFEHFVGSAPDNRPAPTPTHERARHGVLWYQIEVGPRRLLVHVRLLHPPARTSFFLPGQWAGRSDYAGDISIKGAHGPDGPLAFTISRSEGRIDVDSDGEHWVQLDYAVGLRRKAAKLERFHPRFFDDVLFAYGPAFLVLPSEQISSQVRDIPIEVRAPASWHMLATWKPVQTKASRAVPGTTVHGFLAATPGALRDAFVAAGPGVDIEHPATAEHTSSLTVGFDPAVSVDRAQFSARIAQLLAAYRERFGDVGPVSAYVRAIAGGSEERRGVGRRGGFVVEIPADQPLDAQALLLLAHEAFHLWNGHYLTPKPSAERRTRWFKEGVTHYVAIKTLASLGLFSRADVLRELSRSASYYERNPAARAKPSSQTDRARLPYDRGVLLGVALDAMLLRDSGGRVGLEDWIARLLAERTRRGDFYDAAELRAALVGVSGSAKSAAVRMWDTHVAGAQPLDPAKIFNLAGLHWLDDGQQDNARLLPVKRANSPFPKMFPRPNATSTK